MKKVEGKSNGKIQLSTQHSKTQKEASVQREMVEGVWTMEEASTHGAVYLQLAEVPKLAEWADEVIAWAPVRIEGYGNFTRVSLWSGEDLYLPTTAARFYLKMAKQYQLDVDSFRLIYAHRMEKQLLMPLILTTRQTIFCALKCRTKKMMRSYSKNEGVMGYFATQYVKDIAPGRPFLAEKAQMTLVTGQKYDIYMHPQQIQRRFQDGHDFRLKWQDHLRGGKTEWSWVKDFVATH